MNVVPLLTFATDEYPIEGFLLNNISQTWVQVFRHIKYIYIRSDDSWTRSLVSSTYVKTQMQHRADVSVFSPDIYGDYN